MSKLVFWNYEYLHIKKPSFIIDDLYDLNLTFKELITKYHFNFSADLSVLIKILKVDKTKPQFILNNNNPYWDNTTKIIDYIDFYNIKSTNCDIIFKIIH